MSQEPVSGYDADEALASIMKSVAIIGTKLEAIKITSRSRERQYQNDIKSIQAHDLRERVIIAICGATGAGKSSLINAILDNEIVPTSSAAACTSVVTRIQYSPTGEYRAEVHFLTCEEWTKELTALVADVTDSRFSDDDSEQASGSLSEVAKPAWDKFHAVYPNISLQALAEFSIDDLLEDYPSVTELLDEALPIHSETPEVLSTELRDYLETSRKDLRGKFAYWPLIRHVDIFCPADALKTGAVLVDLPGVADLNSARNDIAQKFMEQSHHFWIVTPVQRAVDDRTALDLLGKAWKTQLRLGKCLNPESITYIATKCDGIRVAEAVRSLGLGERPKYQRLSQRVARRAQILRDAEKRYSESCNTVKDIEKSLNAKRARLAELRRFLQVSGVKEATSPGQLKKTGLGQASSSARKRKEAASNSNVKDGPTSNKRARVAMAEAETDSTPMSMPNRTDVEKEVASLDGEVINDRNVCFDHYQAQNDARDAREEAEVAYSRSQKKLVTYCHKARSEFLKKHVQSDFRNDTAGHTQSDMALPVFAVSSREYMRHTDQISGEPLEFTSVDDTGIPALQEWCHTLTLPVRERDARKAASELEAFTISLRTFVEGVPNVAEEQRQAMRADWQSVMLVGSWEDEDESDLLDADEALWEQMGVVWRLVEAFDNLTQECGRDLQRYFKQYLNVRCKEAAKLAAEHAYATSKEFAHGRKWQKYRAILRRGGQFGPEHDLNAELTIPFAVHIASSWRDLFSANLFGKLEKDVMRTIDELVDEFVQGVPEYLKARAQQQADSCRREARSALSTIMATVACELNSEQKRISRGIAPHVQGALLQVYEDALLDTGRGSVARQQQFVHDAVHEKRGDLFGGAASTLMKRLAAAADGIAQSLQPALQKIARKAETNLAVLWEKSFDNDDNGEARKGLLALLGTVLADLAALEHARESRGTKSRSALERQEDDDDDDTNEDTNEDEDADEDGMPSEDDDHNHEDSVDELAEYETGTCDDGGVGDAVVNQEAVRAVSEEADPIADEQAKPPVVETIDIDMDIGPAHHEDGVHSEIKTETKMEDIVEDGRESDSSIGKDA